METELLCASLWNLADMLTMIRGRNLLIFEVRGQKSRSLELYSSNLVNTIEIGPLCASLSNVACIHVLTMWRGWTLLTLGGQSHNRHEWKNFVKTILIEPFCASSSNLANMLTIIRGWTLLYLDVREQTSRLFTVVGCARMLRFVLLYFN